MWFDTHCHLDGDVFDPDRDAVFERARNAGVGRYLNPAYDLASSRRATTLAAQHSDVWAAVGVHPNSAADVLRDEGCLCEIYQLANEPRVVAIGEIGLDFHWDTSPRDVQEHVFIEQLELARKLNLPVIIHCRSGADPVADDAWSRLLTVLFARAWLDERVLLHAFAGTPEQAAAAVTRGYRIGLGGPVTYPRASMLRLIAQSVPLDALVLETDAPYLAPQGHRGRRNEPAYLPIAGLKIAELRGLSAEQLAAQTTRNANAFFGLSDTSISSSSGL